jgi:DNA topoisomerase-1
MKLHQSNEFEPHLSNPQEAARAANLHYVCGDEPGYRRKHWGRGFTYLDKKGHHIQDPKLRQRFKSLTIPPAWTDVWICPSPRGHIQATGLDDKGRKQYIYHPRWETVRNTAKFDRLIPFAEALPKLREQVNIDVGKHKLSQEKVTAVAIRLLEETLIRVGNERYTNLNKSYGLTTLKNEHLSLSGSRIHITFPGKRGIQQAVDVQDRRLARQIARCQDLPGQELFCYLDDDNEVHSLTSGHVNEYLQTYTDQAFTAKEFRTWGASVLAASILRNMETKETQTERQKQIVQMVKEVAQALGNTPAVCRDYYIHPAIMEAHLAGKLKEITVVDEPAEGLSEEETAVLQLLRSQNGT